jgi:nucleoside-diphosphate-sugar epimerase
MEIVVAGSTSLIGTEIIRQALANPAVKSVLALGRRETALPPNLDPAADTSKLKSVVLEDFENYTEDVKKQLQAADAVIW